MGIETTQQIAGKDCVTNSSMACFKQCRRKYYYSYELGWRPAVEKAPLRFGSQFHAALDELCKGEDYDVVINKIDIAYDTVASNLFDPEKIYDLQMECQTLKTLLSGYVAAWADSQIKIIESETSFQLPIINPETGYPARIFQQAGKRDRLGILPDGRTALIETKTVSDDITPGSDYRNVLSINQQISMYVLAAKAEGHDIETTIYDCIRKPTIRPCDVALTDEQGIKVVLDEQGQRVLKANGEPRQTGDTAKGYTLQTRPMTAEEWDNKLSADILDRPDFYYQRFEVPRLESDLKEFAYELWDIAQDINTARKNNLWYRNTGACRAWSSLCPYYGLCSGQLSTDTLPDGFRQVETVHEELNQ